MRQDGRDFCGAASVEKLKRNITPNTLLYIHHRRCPSVRIPLVPLGKARSLRGASILVSIVAPLTSHWRSAGAGADSPHASSERSARLLPKVSRETAETALTAPLVTVPPKNTPLGKDHQCITSAWRILKFHRRYVDVQLMFQFLWRRLPAGCGLRVPLALRYAFRWRPAARPAIKV